MASTPVVSDVGPEEAGDLRERRVEIFGDGAAGRCCARLLGKSGYGAVLRRKERARVPAILLSETALHLIRDVYEAPALFSGQRRIQRRIVKWGRGGETVTVPHAGVVVSEVTLLAALGEIEEGSGATESGVADFAVYAGAPVETAHALERFGKRSAEAAPVEWVERVSLDAVYVESTPEGWLFLIPGEEAGPGAWLLAIGTGMQEQLAMSTLIAPRIRLAGSPRAFDSAPRRVNPLCGEGWLACGSAAMGFDPICGDGTAAAVREAVLASAAIGGIFDGGDPEGLLRHYRAKLTAAMLKHLSLCFAYYETGGTTRWWAEELEAMREGYEICRREMERIGEPGYRLNGFRLEPVA